MRNFAASTETRSPGLRASGWVGNLHIEKRYFALRLLTFRNLANFKEQVKDQAMGCATWI